MSFPPSSYSLSPHRISLREGFMYVGGYGGTPVGVGLTSGGVTINLNPDYANVESDQLHSYIDIIPTLINGTIETRLMELSLWHLALAMGLPSSAVGGSSVLTVDFASLAAVNNFHSVKIETFRPPLTSSTASGVRTFEFPKTKFTSPGEFYTLSRTDVTTIPVTINILGDWDESAGSETFFTITDAGVEWEIIDFWS